MVDCDHDDAPTMQNSTGTNQGEVLTCTQPDTQYMQSIKTYACIPGTSKCTCTSVGVSKQLSSHSFRDGIPEQNIQSLAYLGNIKIASRKHWQMLLLAEDDYTVVSLGLLKLTTPAQKNCYAFSFNYV